MGIGKRNGMRGNMGFMSAPQMKLYYLPLSNIYRGSYTSDHLIQNLVNEPLASLINSIRNDHSCKILFIK